jgi:hypothetical protein
VRALNHERFLAAANVLEGVVLDEYRDDEHFDELVEMLTLYAPGQGGTYSD